MSSGLDASIFESIRDEAETIGFPIHDADADDNNQEFFASETSSFDGGPYDTPDDKFFKKGRRKAGAQGYEDKIKKAVRAATDFTIQTEPLVPDAAALIMYGPQLATAGGNWAAEDKRVARVIDFFAEDSPIDSAALGFIAVAAPLLLQIVRNHEPVLEPAPRGFRIPFAKDKQGNPRRFRFPFKIGIKLGGLRGMTNEPSGMVRQALTPEIVELFTARGIEPAIGRRRA